MRTSRTLSTLAACTALLWTATAGATTPYTPIALPPGAVPGIGPGLISPAATFGKEYSHDVDESTTLGGGTFDPEQVIAWDGIGGTADGLDYTGTRPSYTPDDQVDAIANHNDALFNRLLQDQAHLIFSHDDMITTYTAAGPATGPFVPSSGPVVLTGGAVIGGSGELSYELAGAFAPPSTKGVWATQPEINSSPVPVDVDGVEVWGPEPALSGDADKYSLQVDAFSGIGLPASGTSIWNLSGTPYISQATILSAVTSLLGPVPAGAGLPFPTQIEGQDAINLDALMVRDVFGEEDTFDRSLDGGPGDQIIFSIQQIPNPADPDGYYATGSELFVLDATLGPGGTTYLSHGGHLWDHAYALSDLAISPDTFNGYGVIDINAIEAVGELVVPEPTALVLLMSCFGAAAAMRYRLG